MNSFQLYLEVASHGTATYGKNICIYIHHRNCKHIKFSCLDKQEGVLSGSPYKSKQIS